MISAKTYGYLLFLLTILGLIVRLFRLPSLWDGDFAQYFLVAQHIVKYGEIPLVGQYASAINGHYSPWGYYFLALIMSLSSQMTFVVGFLAVLHGLSIFTIYRIGGLIFKNKKTGFLAAFFFAVSSAEIFYARSLMGNSIIIPIILLSFFFLFKYMRTSYKKYLFYAYLLIFLSGLFNIAQLVVLPVYVLTEYIKDKKIKFSLAAIILLTTVYLILNIPLLLSLDIKFTSTPRMLNFSLQNFFSAIYLFFLSIFPSQPANILPAELVLAVLLFINFILVPKLIKPLLFPFLMIFITVLAVSLLNNRNCCSSYFTHVFPLFFLISAYGIHALTKFRSFIVKILAFFFLIIIIYLITNDLHPMYIRYEAFPSTEKLTEEIIADAKRKKYNDFQVLVGDRDSGAPIFWHSPTVWYFLENKLNKKFTRVTNENESNLEMTAIPERIYLICESQAEKFCRENFSLGFSNFRAKYKIKHQGGLISFLYQKVN